MLDAKQQRDIEYLNQVIITLHQFIKVVSYQSSAKCEIFVKQIPYYYCQAAYDVLQFIRDHQKLKKKLNSLSLGIRRCGPGMDSFEEKNMNQPKIKQNKMQDVSSYMRQHSDLNRIINLLNKKQYAEAKILANKDMDGIIRDLQEYNTLKSLINKNQYLVIEISEISIKSSIFYQFEDIIINYLSTKQKIEEEFKNILLNILDERSVQNQSKKYTWICQQNQHLVERLQAKQYALKQQNTRLNEQVLELNSIIQNKDRISRYDKQYQTSLQPKKLGTSGKIFKKFQWLGRYFNKKMLIKINQDVQLNCIIRKIRSLIKSKGIQTQFNEQQIKIPIQQINIKILQHIYDAIENIFVINQSLQYYNEQLKQKEINIKLALHQINLQMLDMLTIQEGVSFNQQQQNQQKCNIISENAILLQTKIERLQKKLISLERIKNFNPNKSAIFVSEDLQDLPLQNKQQEYDETIKQLKQQIKILQQKYQSLLYRNAELNKEIQPLNARIIKLKNQIKVFEEGKNKTDAIIKNLRQDLEQEKKQISENRNRLQKQRIKISELNSKIGIEQNDYETQNSYETRNHKIQRKEFSNQQQSALYIQEPIQLKKITVAQQIEILKAKITQRERQILKIKNEGSQKLIKIEEKFRSEKYNLSKNLSNLQKYKNEIEVKYKQLKQEHIQLRVQMNELLQNKKQMQILEQQSKIDNGANTSSIQQYCEIKRSISQSKEIIQKKLQWNQKIKDLEERITILQNENYQQQNLVNNITNRCEDILKDKISEQNLLAENLQKFNLLLVEKDQQIRQLKLIMQERQKQFPKSINLIQERQRYIEHFFNSGDIFDQMSARERKFLIKQLQARRGELKRTRLIYKYDTYNKVNVHKYLDQHKQIVVIVRTIYGKIIAGYSQEAFTPNGIKRGYGLLLSLWNQKIFELIQGKRAITYDDFYIIFGNSQIRLKSLQLKIFSNFGIANAYYQTYRFKIQEWLGENDRQVDIEGYEIYQLEFKNDY